MGRNFLVGVCLMLLVLCVGCSSPGFHQQGAKVNAREKVFVYLSSYFVRYQTHIHTSLQRHGLDVVSEREKADLICRTDFQPGYTLHAEITLWRGDTVLVSGESFNGGWGTMLASGLASDAAVRGSIQTFDREMSRIAPATGEPPIRTAKQTGSLK